MRALALLSASLFLLSFFHTGCGEEELLGKKRRLWKRHRKKDHDDVSPEEKRAGPKEASAAIAKKSFISASLPDPNFLAGKHDNQTVSEDAPPRIPDFAPPPTKIKSTVPHSYSEVRSMSVKSSPKKKGGPRKSGKKHAKRRKKRKKKHHKRKFKLKGALRSLGNKKPKKSNAKGKDHDRKSVRGGKTSKRKRKGTLLSKASIGNAVGKKKENSKKNKEKKRKGLSD